MDAEQSGMRFVKISSERDKALFENITGLELKKEWRLATEKRPEYDKHVLVLSEDGDFCKCFLDKSEHKWCKVGQYGEIAPYKKRVLYWIETDFPL